jgi:hypothetical protein
MALLVTMVWSSGRRLSDVLQLSSDRVFGHDPSFAISHNQRGSSGDMFGPRNSHTYLFVGLRAGVSAPYGVSISLSSVQASLALLLIIISILRPYHPRENLIDHPIT